jgi:hypothetical protein
MKKKTSWWAPNPNPGGIDNIWGSATQTTPEIELRPHRTHKKSNTLLGIPELPNEPRLNVQFEKQTCYLMLGRGR